MNRLPSDVDPLGHGPEDAETPDADRAAFGDFLRQARERRQLTLQEIAARTKIPSRHLSALEHGDVGALPAGMYRRAMLRAYAESVGLDSADAMGHFERAFEHPAPPAPAARAGAPGPAISASAPRRSGMLLAVVVIAATVIVALTTEDSDRGDARGPAVGSSVSPSNGAAGVQRAVPEPTAETISATSGAADPPTTVASGSRSLASAGPGARRDEGAIDAGAARVPSVPATETPDEAASIAPTTRPAGLGGELVIASAPEGARVTVNGTGWGATPVTVRHLPFGVLRVRVTKDGYISREAVVRVDASRPVVRLNLALSARE